MEALGESVFGLLEWRVRACSIEKCSGQERRAIRSGGIFIGLSQETSYWAQIQNSGRVQGSWTMFGRVVQSLIGSLCGTFLNFGANSGRAGQSPTELDIVRHEVSVLDDFEKTWSLAWISNLHFFHHTRHNSTVLLYSRNIKMLCSIAWAPSKTFYLNRQELGVSFLLLFGYLNSCLILIEMIRFLFVLFSITEIN
jgi:hypothetical protein